MLKKYLLFLILIIESTLASEKSLYEFKWLDDDEKVFVIQNKEHIKAKSIGLDFSIIQSDSSPYQDTTGASLALTYYFSENWSIDFTYKKYLNSDSADLSNLLSAYSNEVKPLIRRIDAAKIIHFNWIPFYGKINTFNKFLFFDWGFGLGIGQFDTAGNYKTFLEKNVSITYLIENDTGVNLRSYVKFYTKTKMTFGFEYNITAVETIRNKDATKEILYFNDIIATIGYIF